MANLRLVRHRSFFFFFVAAIKFATSFAATEIRIRLVVAKVDVVAAKRPLVYSAKCASAAANVHFVMTTFCSCNYRLASRSQC